MAVYTQLQSDDIQSLLATYSNEVLMNFEGITAGVENTNYMLTTDTRKLILTVYEKRVRKEDLPFYLSLMEHLHQHNIPCPTALRNHNNDFLSTIEQKSCALISFLSGKSVRHIKNIHCAELGKHMAHMHLASKNFDQSLHNSFSIDSWLDLFNQVKNNADELKPGLKNEIEGYLNKLTNHWPTNLPTGIIHGDLFPDNVFFENNILTGIIDFYFACTDSFMYDIAICLNAWCFEDSNDFNLTKAKHLLTSYNAVRTITEKELEALPMLAMGAAMRFFLTRLYDWFNRSSDAIVTPKDPKQYLTRLRFHHNVTSVKQYGL